MKKLLLFAVIAATVTISSCSTQKKAEVFLKSKCPDSGIVRQSDGTFRLSISCTNLYKTEEIKKYLSEGKISYDAVNAELYISGVSNDSIPNVLAILKSIAKGVKK